MKCFETLERENFSFNRKVYLSSEVTTATLLRTVILSYIRALSKFIAIIFPRPLILSNLGQFSKSWILKTAPNCTRENELCHRLFSLCIKKTHSLNVVLVTQRNVSKSVMHVHSYYFAYKLIAFLTFLLSMARAISNRSRSSEWTLRD